MLCQIVLHSYNSYIYVEHLKTTNTHLCAMDSRVWISNEMAWVCAKLMPILLSSGKLIGMWMNVHEHMDIVCQHRAYTWKIRCKSIDSYMGPMTYALHLIWHQYQAANVMTLISNERIKYNQRWGLKLTMVQFCVKYEIGIHFGAGHCDR